MELVGSLSIFGALGFIKEVVQYGISRAINVVLQSHDRNY
jgi:hypothetical protein